MYPTPSNPSNPSNPADPANPSVFHLHLNACEIHSSATSLVISDPFTPLAESAREHVSDEDWKYFRIVRLYGRDRRFSFEWDGMYFELNAEECDVLQWLLILDRLESSPRSTMETRILRPSGNPSPLSEVALSERIKAFFNVYSGSKDRFSVTFLDDRKGFVRSNAGDKIIKFEDIFN
ncbi:uncharacterized protein N7498_008640 [Penicillium cinerascens]|uniref:Uncharacterized protein n=1 Tax=Penicillium cinerascens TaxID=70096 RepID=A0A9W9MCG4_9EURO|nr:uncharacterized protein N7498_008640 [Penicillium cinerascens]KAJ5195202.1 hypothetical protein N7498_008640 [Penicillium cinerascens]